VECAAGSGVGLSKPGAFHAALEMIGASKFNLITVSSVVPAGWQVQAVNRLAADDQVKMGDRLVGVLAISYAEGSTSNVTCAAALAWAVASDEAGGYIAEAAADSGSNARRKALGVLDELTLVDGRTAWERSSLDATAEAGPGQTACALVFAAYAFQSWDNTNAAKE
jgi:arginine decarboxylase